MEWQKSEIGQIWHRSHDSIDGGTHYKAVIHYNEYTLCYDVAVYKRYYEAGAGVSAQGLRTLEEAQEWVRLMV